MKNIQKKMTLWILLAILILVVTGVLSFLSQPSFGKQPSGERLERIQRSPNYRNGMFQNQIPTPMMTGDGNRWQALWKFVFGNHKGLRPEKAMPAIRTNLKQLPQKSNLMVWFGHSSYFLQVDGKKILVDPVFYAAAPVSFINKPFKGTDIFRPEDMPNIDLLIITHDHWDHLDYKAVKELHKKVSKVVCPLGVGAHFEYWGYHKEQLIEQDWGGGVPIQQFDCSLSSKLSFFGTWTFFQQDLMGFIPAGICIVDLIPWRRWRLWSAFPADWEKVPIH